MLFLPIAVDKLERGTATPEELETFAAHHRTTIDPNPTGRELGRQMMDGSRGFALHSQQPYWDQWARLLSSSCDTPRCQRRSAM